MNKPDGGPAFPSGYTVTDDKGTVEGQHKWGMTLRDYFAGQALIGLLAFSTQETDIQYEPEEAALFAYEYADAMIAEKGM